MPSLLERQGNFSEAGNNNIFDPLTGLQFTNNTIPDARINQVAKSLLATSTSLKVSARMSEDFPALV